jgi:multisubunit Na+/H+ antiporter MnhF subunit
MIEYIFLAAGMIAAARAIIGPTFADRVIATGSVVSVIVFFMVYMSVQYGTALYLDIAIVLVLLSFVGTLAIAKFINPRETREGVEG